MGRSTVAVSPSGSDGYQQPPHRAGSHGSDPGSLSARGAAHTRKVVLSQPECGGPDKRTVLCVQPRSLYSRSGAGPKTTDSCQGLSTSRGIGDQCGGSIHVGSRTESRAAILRTAGALSSLGSN